MLGLRGAKASHLYYRPFCASDRRICRTIKDVRYARSGGCQTATQQYAAVPSAKLLPFSFVMQLPPPLRTGVDYGFLLGSNVSKGGENDADEIRDWILGYTGSNSHVFQGASSRHLGNFRRRLTGRRSFCPAGLLFSQNYAIIDLCLSWYAPNLNNHR